MNEQDQTKKPQEQTNKTNSRQAGNGESASGKINPLEAIIENLEILKSKISKNGAYLGVLGGFGVFAFSLFLTWSKIPSGMEAMDGGAVSGWSEKAYWAIVPLVISLFPVFIQRAVWIKTLLVTIVLSFGLLGYNNVLHRTSWGTPRNYATLTPGSNFGSDLGVGFWFGLIAIAAVAVCGIAWALHTRGQTSGGKA